MYLDNFFFAIEMILNNKKQCKFLKKNQKCVVEARTRAV